MDWGKPFMTTISPKAHGLTLQATSKQVPQDPPAKLPAYPRFIREAVLIPTPEGLLVDGTAEPSIIRTGPNADSLLYLVSLLDGTRTVTDLAHLLPGIRGEDLTDTLTLLNKIDLLEESDLHLRESRGYDQTRDYLRRQISVNSRNPSGSEALIKLKRHQIFLITQNNNEPIPAWVECFLEKSGFTVIGTPSLTDLEATLYAEGLDRKLVVAASLSGQEHCWFQRVAKICSPNRIPWIRLALDVEHKSADIGPLFNRKTTSPCYECYWAIHGKDQAQQLFPSEADVALFMGLAFTEITYVLSESSSSWILRGFIRYSLLASESQHLYISRLPGCQTCHPHPDILQTEGFCAEKQYVDVSYVFEEYVRSLARSESFLDPPNDESRLYGLLLQQSKRYPTCTQVTLPAVEYAIQEPVLKLLQEEGLRSAGSVSLHALSTLLKLSAGIRGEPDRGGKLQRWTASAGNFGSVELYAVVLRVEDLEEGIYFYQPADHCLARFRRKAAAITPSDLLRRAVRLNTEVIPDAFIIFTGAYHRLTRKYGPFGYRLVNFDAGVAVTQLCAVAASLGIKARLADRWADDLIEKQLALAGMDEQCTAVVALFGGYAADVQSARLPRYGGTQLKSRLESRKFQGQSLKQVAEQVYWSSRMQEEDIDEAIEKTQSSFDRGHIDVDIVGQGETVVLPENLNPGQPIAEVVSRRVSVRRFLQIPVTLPTVATVLRTARAPLSRYPGGKGLSIIVLVLGVAALSPGLYSYEPDSDHLRRQTDLPSQRVLESLFVQPSFATAPIIIVMMGNLPSAIQHRGAYGHRLLLLTAGILAQRFWLAAMASELMGAITAGIVTRVAQESLGMDGYYRAPMLAFACGIPGESDT
jgi:SagB-type dehydrogenase family enzyme